MTKFQVILIPIQTHDVPTVPLAVLTCVVISQLHGNPGSEHAMCTLGPEPAITPHTNKLLKLLSSAWRMLTCSVFRCRFQGHKPDTGRDYARVRPPWTTQCVICWPWPHKGCPGLEIWKEHLESRLKPKGWQETSFRLCAPAKPLFTSLSLLLYLLPSANLEGCSVLLCS